MWLSRTIRTGNDPVKNAARVLAWVATAVLLLALVMGGGRVAQADVGDSYAGMFVGTTTFGIQTYSTYGAAFGGSYGHEYAANRLWTLGATFASTAGQTTDTSGKTFDLSAGTAEFKGGLVAYLSPVEDAVRPYLGAGLSVLSYKLDFTGTDVGKTSGTGPGVFGEVGMELRLTPHFTLIPQFGVQEHSVKLASGATTGLLSGGLVFTLRITD